MNNVLFTSSKVYSSAVPVVHMILFLAKALKIYLFISTCPLTQPEAWISVPIAQAVMIQGQFYVPYICYLCTKVDYKISSYGV